MNFHFLSRTLGIPRATLQRWQKASVRNVNSLEVDQTSELALLCQKILNYLLVGGKKSKTHARQLVPKHTAEKPNDRRAARRKQRRDGTVSFLCKAWNSEKAKRFSIVGSIGELQLADGAPLRLLPTSNGETWLRERQWMRHGAWTFCKECGVLKPAINLVTHDGTTRSKPWYDTVCRGSRFRCNFCDMHPDMLETQIQEGHPRPHARGKLMAYITPNIDYWPKQVITLNHDVLKLLAPLEIYCEFSCNHGGKAPVTNCKKLSVVRAEWKAHAVEKSAPPPPPREKERKWAPLLTYLDRGARDFAAHRAARHPRERGDEGGTTLRIRREGRAYPRPSDERAPTRGAREDFSKGCCGE